jgi:hypothetical protein
MKIEQLLVLSIAVFFVEAGPARTDCGVTKTFEAKNACSVTYGGSVHTLLQLHTSKLLIKTSTWVECASGVTEMPTFLMPSCSIDAAQADDPTITALEAAETPAITPAPVFTDPFAPKPANETEGCRALWVCVDAIASCGNDGTRIGTYVNHPSSILPILPILSIDMFRY